MISSWHQEEQNPSMDFIPCGILKFDPRYQRDTNPALLQAILREFDPLKLGTVYVSKREKGEIYVLDGQHRILAMLKKLGPTALASCLVYSGLSEPEEGELFVGFNGGSSGKGRRVVPICYRVRALAFAGDESWLDIINLLEKLDIQHVWNDRITDVKILKCWHALEAIRNKAGIEHLERALRVILAIWDGQPVTLETYFVRGMADFLWRYGRDKKSPYSDKKLIEKLSTYSLAELRKAQGKFRALGHTAAPAMTCAFLYLYNSGRGSGRIGPGGPE